MHTEPQRGEARPLMLAVRSTEDIEFLVKESEVLTGLPGRRFVIAGADRLTYRLLWHPLGFKVQRLDERGKVLHTQNLMTFEFLDHSLLEALHAGQLFTVPVDFPPRRNSLIDLEPIGVRKPAQETSGPLRPIDPPATQGRRASPPDADPPCCVALTFTEIMMNPNPFAPLYPTGRSASHRHGSSPTRGDRHA